MIFLKEREKAKDFCLISNSFFVFILNKILILLFNRSLYEKKRSHSYTQRRSEEEYIKESKFSFKPTINEMPKEIYGDS